MDEEKLDEIEIDLGDDSTFYVANNGAFFGIAFGKIFRSRSAINL